MRSTRLAPAGAAPLARLGLAASLTASLVACTVHTDEPNLAGQDVRLTILHTADTHSRIFPYQFAPGAIDEGLGLLPKSGSNIAIVGGFARLATLIRQQRAASQRVIHLDSGDIFEGAPVFNIFGGEVEMKAMSRLGLNAMALGNHEFDKGAVNLELQKANFGGFPILAANYQFVDPSDPSNPKLRDVIAPFAIFNVQGLKIAVIGMGNLSSLQGLVEGGNSLGIVPLETRRAIQDTVNLVRSSVDLVVVVSHMGLDEDESAAQAQSAQGLSGAADQSTDVATDGVDVVLGGHLHIVLNPPNIITHQDAAGNVVGRTIICHSGAFAKYLGRLDLSVHVADPKVPGDKPSAKSYTYEILPVTDAIPEDPDMANMLEPYQFKLNTTLNLTKAYAVVPCDPTASTCPKVVRADPDGGDSQLGNLVATSMRLRRRVEADFGLTNSLGIRADFESGLLNLEEMYNVFPFENTITTMFLSGDEIQEMLNFVAARSSERGCKAQSQVSGIWFVGDCKQRPDADGVSRAHACGPFDANGALAAQCTGDRTIDGPFLLGDDCRNHPEKCRAVLPSGEYSVAVNDYIAAGGSGFAVLKRNTSKFNTGISLRDSLLDYISEQSIRCDQNKYTNLMSIDPLAPSLPCIDPTITDPEDPAAFQPHDGRITMVGGN